MSDNKTIKDMQMLIEKMNRVAKVIATSSVQFDLPRIVVIGSQSEGKSSVLESIVGKRFLPRGSEITTRVPIEIHLHHDPALDDLEVYAVFAADGIDGSKKMYNFDEVINEIEFRTNKRAASKRSISKTSIIMDIYSSNVINLQLVDLPGFVQNPLPDQPHDIQKQIEELVTYFTSKPDTLILAISSATDDLVNSVAIKHALTVDPEGKRTIGVITKLDMLQDEGKIASVVKVLNNEVLSLRMGYIGVINSNQDQVLRKSSLEDVRQGEMNFFKGHKAYQHLYGKIGTEYLQNFLHRQFYQIIRAKMPEIIIAAQKEIRLTDDNLKRLNYSAEADKEPQKDKVQRKIRDYCEAVKVALEGNSVKVSVFETEAGAAIKEFLKEKIEEACKEAMIIDNKDIQKKMLKICTNMDGANDFLLPNGLSFRIMVGILADQFKNPLKNLIEDITHLLMDHLKNLAEKILSVNPNLKSEVLDIVLKKIDAFRQACIGDVELQIEVQKIYINTFHPDFENYKRLLRGQRDQGEFSNANDAGDESDEEQDPDMPESFLETLKSMKEFARARAGLFVQLQRGLQAQNQKPGIIAAPTDLTDAAKFFLEMVFAYMAIIDKTLNDMTKRFIMYRMVHKVTEYFDDPRILNLEKLNLEENECKRLMESNAADQRKIVELLQTKRNVEEAIVILEEE